MPIHHILLLDFSEEGYTEDGEEKQKQHQQGSDIDHLGYGQNEGLEDLMQVFRSLDELEYTRNPKRSDDGGYATHIDIEYLEKDYADPG